MGNAPSAKAENREAANIEAVAELRIRHTQLKQRLDALNRHVSLTPAEHIESLRLKKEKLAIKDRIATLGGQV